MQNSALLTAGVVFLIVAVFHLLRLVFRWEAKIGKLIVPMWVSVAGFILALSLSLWMFSLAYTADNPVTFASDTYIFSSTQSQDFFGEGFFLNLRNGKEFFIYSKPEDNPHDLANTKRKFYALIKARGSFRQPEARMVDVYLSSKYDLNVFAQSHYGFSAEHSSLPAKDYLILAGETRNRGLHKITPMIYYKSLSFGENEIEFSAREISNIKGVVMTTGGSVYIFTIERKDGEPLSVVIAAREENAQEKLTDFMQQVSRISGSDKMIIAKNVQYQHEIFTFDGVRAGWTAFIDNVSIK